MKIYVFWKVTRVHMCIGFSCVSAYRHTFNKGYYSVSILFQLPLGMDASTTTVRPAPICYGEPRSPLPVRPSLLCYEHFLTQSLPCKPAPLRNDNPKTSCQQDPLFYVTKILWRDHCHANPRRYALKNQVTQKALPLQSNFIQICPRKRKRTPTLTASAHLMKKKPDRNKSDKHKKVCLQTHKIKHIRKCLFLMFFEPNPELENWSTSTLRATAQRQNMNKNIKENKRWKEIKRTHNNESKKCSWKVWQHFVARLGELWYVFYVFYECTDVKDEQCNCVSCFYLEVAYLKVTNKKQDSQGLYSWK